MTSPRLDNLTQQFRDAFQKAGPDYEPGGPSSDHTEAADVHRDDAHNKLAHHVSQMLGSSPHADISKPLRTMTLHHKAEVMHRASAQSATSAAPSAPSSTATATPHVGLPVKTGIRANAFSSPLHEGAKL